MSSDVTEWRWADPSGQQRLIRADELRAALASGVVAPNTPVWHPGWKDWRPAQEVPELQSSALSAANGVVPNIPPPPLAVVAVQAAFEGAPARASTGEEPPPPPRYVPLAPRAQPNHTPSQPLRASGFGGTNAASSLRASPVPIATASQTSRNVAIITPLPHDANTAVNLRPMKDADAELALQPNVHPRETLPMGGRVDDPPRAPSASKRPPPVSVPPPPPPSSRPKGLAALVRAPAQQRTSRPPPQTRSSRPPPPHAMSSRPPPPKPSVAPRPAPHVEPQNVEELSGSMLLPDASGSSRVDAIEELSGSILLSDASGAIPANAVAAEVSRVAALPPDPIPPAAPAPTAAPIVPAAVISIEPAKKLPPEELSGSFLLDAGSTGALPSLDSDSAIRSAPAARAPFAAEDTSGRESRPTPVALNDVIAPLALPLGPASIPPPNPSSLSPATRPEFVPVAAIPAPMASLEPIAPTPNPPLAGASGENYALPTLVGRPPPPDFIPGSPDASIKPAPSPDVAPFERPPASRTAFTPPPQSAGSLPIDPAMPLPPPPPPERSTARLHDFRSLSPDGRAKYMIPAVAALGVLVLMGVIGLIVGALRKKPSDEPIPPASALVTDTPAPSAVQLSIPAAKAPVRANVAAPCSLAGSAHVVAPRAVVQGGVEAQAVGTRLALGFATAPRTGVAVGIDSATLAVTQSVRSRASDAIRRVVPVPSTHGFAAAADGDRAGDALAGRRTVSADPPFDLGLAAGGLAWAPFKSNESDVLWTLDGDAPVEAIRAVPLDPSNKDAGWAIAFRRGASIFAGTTSGGATLLAKGPLLKVDGLGPQVGSPAIAAQDGVILVAWADRAQSSDPWSLRWMRFAPGDASADAKPFVPSEGGLGEQAMSPAVIAAGQGRFVMAWTEGPVSNHQVRAQTITANAVPVGAPIPISEAGVNAGQAQLAVLPDGRGVVAYLAATGDGPKAPYEVLATPIACP